MASAIDSKISGLNSVDLREVSRRPGSKNDVEGFANALDKELVKSTAIEEKVKSEKPILKFSNHALDRMNTRGIFITPEQVTKIEQAMQKASDKGAKETLVLTDNAAMIVSLKNSTVVTVMDKDSLKENVFTNIDSTVVV